MKTPFIKVCGMTSLEQVQELASLGVDYAGFIFYDRSPRYVVGKMDPARLKAFQAIQKIGVFVKASLGEIEAAVNDYGLQYVQLHGDESPEFCKEVAQFVKVIKVFRVSGTESLAPLIAPFGAVSAFLFDTKAQEYGGTGLQFNWSLLERYSYPQPYFLSGGIGLTDVSAVIEFAKKNAFHAVDVNSKFEMEPGIKDMAAIKKFITALRNMPS